jgi:hypothetical protein
MNGTTITGGQRAAHVASEAVAVLAVAPFMFWLSREGALSPTARRISALIGIATLAVDGALLASYLGGSSSRELGRL